MLEEGGKVACSGAFVALGPCKVLKAVCAPVAAAVCHLIEAIPGLPAEDVCSIDAFSLVGTPPCSVDGRCASGQPVDPLTGRCLDISPAASTRVSVDATRTVGPVTPVA